jgi:Na+-transporting NADH:ubiquinone oxidoreductase subunit C
MVVIVAALLSFVAEELKPMQERNVEVEKKLDILRSVRMTEGIDEAKNKNAFIEEQFEKYISESFVVNSKGETISGKDAFQITQALKVEVAKPVEERDLPVFIYQDAEGERKIIIPLLGKGLWGSIWGYISFSDDYRTIYGAVFDHAKETPGLGAEINEEWFEEKFTGKMIFDTEGKFISIAVVKGATDPASLNQIDAISGGTITSKGLEAMIHDCLLPYETYFKNQLKEGL